MVRAGLKPPGAVLAVENLRVIFGYWHLWFVICKILTNFWLIRVSYATVSSSSFLYTLDRGWESTLSLTRSGTRGWLGECDNWPHQGTRGTLSTGVSATGVTITFLWQTDERIKSVTQEKKAGQGTRRLLGRMKIVSLFLDSRNNRKHTVQIYRQAADTGYQAPAFLLLLLKSYVCMKSSNTCKAGGPWVAFTWWLLSSEMLELSKIK